MSTESADEVTQIRSWKTEHVVDRDLSNTEAYPMSALSQLEHSAQPLASQKFHRIDS